MLSLPNKIYMIAEDETEETLTLVAMLEGISLNRLCENIDLHRSAGCGFARAAKIFATHYLHVFLDSESASHPYSNALALQKAMSAVANDRPESDSEPRAAE